MELNFNEKGQKNNDGIKVCMVKIALIKSVKPLKQKYQKNKTELSNNLTCRSKANKKIIHVFALPVCTLYSLHLLQIPILLELPKKSFHMKAIHTE